MRRTSLVVAALVGLASLGVVTPAHADFGSGFLEGTLTDARTGLPVSGVYVSPYRISTDGFYDARTDADGHWSIELPDDTYKVNALTFSGLYKEQWAVGKSDLASATPYDVTNGSHTTIDMALVPYPTVSGRITDTSGAPVAGFCPTLVEGDPANGNGYGGGCTDSDGRYTVGTTITGTYSVHFRDYQKPYADQWFRNVTTAADATTFSVADTSAITGIDAVLKPEAVITTGVTDSAGTPLAATVSAFDLAGNFVGSGGYTDGSTATATLGQLPAGTYVLLANESSPVLHRPRYLGGTLTAKGATRITVTTGQHLTVPPIKLPLGGSITGLVKDAVTGAPIENACVGTSLPFRSQDVFILGGNVGDGAACTDATGRYTVTTLETGSYPVGVVDGSGTHADVFLPNAVDSGEAKTYKVKVGETTTVPNARLVAAGSVTGTITLSGPDSPLYTCVIAFTAGTRDQLGSGGCADENGTFTVTGLATNSYKLQIQYPPAGYASVFAPGVATFKGAATYRVRAGATTTGANISVPKA